MKLLEKNELGGIDSTSKTIEKWDEFLKKAVWNLGFSQELIDNMYPYEKGIPLNNGEYLPVDEVTGRRFFKMSMADKLAGMLGALQTNTHYLDTNYLKIVKVLILDFLKASRESYDACFEPSTFDSFESAMNRIDLKLSTCFDDDLADEWRIVNDCYSKFLKQCTIIAVPYTAGADAYPHVVDVENDIDAYWVNADMDVMSLRGIPSGAFHIIYNPKLNNIFATFPKDVFRNIAAVMQGYNNYYSKLKSYDEVYLQDYLCVSLNPIDKLMCSTKQAFSSCMSLAKQNDTYGTNSAPALNLPSMFPTDSVFLTFMTPGKHKNMYWESEEWNKPGEDRDKEKAYKYLKMTCRALTYKGTMRDDIQSSLDSMMQRNPSFANVCIDLLDEADCERLYIGRQYAASGEDYMWEFLIGYLLHKAGVATNMSLVEKLAALGEARKERVIQGCNFKSEDVIQTGKLSDNGLVVADRFKFIRSVYLDNIVTEPISVNLTSCSDYSGMYIAKSDDFIEKHPRINVGPGRRGSHSMWTGLNRKDACDAFKIMTGIQNYTYLNRAIKICSECGELLDGATSNSKLADGRVLCEKCREKLNVKLCPGCGELYTEDQANQHKVYNIYEYIDPEHASSREPKYMCYSQLKACSDTDDGMQMICAHCGDSLNMLWRSSVQFALLNIDDLRVKVSVCDKCLRKAVMCDKCKRVIFLENTSDACLLLPNRRVICPDCIDSIRLKQETKKLYKELLSSATVEDLERPTPATDISILDEVARKIEERGRTIGTRETLIKDVQKQIASYIAAHPEEGLPVLKTSELPLPNDEIELPF